MTELAKNDMLLKHSTPSEQQLLIDFEEDYDPSITLGEAMISEVTWGCYPYKPKCQSDWDELIVSEIGYILVK